MRTLYALTMAALLVGCGDGDGTKTPTDTGADATIADDTAQASDTVAVGGDAADASEDAKWRTRGSRGACATRPSTTPGSAA